MKKNPEIVVITGSSNKFGEEIYAHAQALREEGVFVIDDSAFHALPEPIARKWFMRNILNATKLLVYNKNGYVGFHSQVEIAIAEIAGIRVVYLFAGRKFPVEQLSDLFYEWKERMK